MQRVPAHQLHAALQAGQLGERRGERGRPGPDRPHEHNQEPGCGVSIVKHRNYIQIRMLPLYYCIVR